MMEDNLNITGAQDKVNINEPGDVKYWTKKWNITEEQLHNAVGAVGVVVKKIETWLRNNGKIK